VSVEQLLATTAMRAAAMRERNRERTTTTLSGGQGLK
jgi:hypothetical protein